MDIVLPKATKDRDDVARTFAHLANLVSETPPAGADPIAFMRAQVERYGAAEPVSVPADVEVRPVSVDGIGAEWLLPAGWKQGPHARLVYLHGGAWAAGSLNSHRPLAASLAKRLGYPVLLVAYALAPEHPFPAGLNDCAAALAWARTNGPEGEGATASLFLAGDSAGGNFAAAATVKGIVEGGEVPDRLLLLSGALELSHNEGRAGIIDPLNSFARQEAQFEGIHFLYLQERAQPSDPLVSPLQASDATIARFPPTLLQVSNSEFLLWDGQHFAAKLIAGGVRTQLSVWAGLPHVWQIFPSLPETDAALGEAATFLKP
ncbi:alpha/beta hydrolase [Sphingomonas sp. PAMC 26605]|uniref:alpha/beta hydrolase n=1 Tax=Sphingomonas sp. PAMC 26605 TaxID=1112214 RepID=UPI00026CB115|nr:alpha/beta hydrolase [Sphingomonas sp. PAMC 26605]